MARSRRCVRLEAQRRDLLRHQAHEKHHHREHQQEHGAVRNARLLDARSRRRRRRRARTRRALIGTKILSGLKIVITFSRIRKNFAPSRASRIFDCPDPLARLDRLEAHVVAGAQKGQRRRRRRREAVRQQMQELEQIARGARREIRTSDRESGAARDSPPGRSADRCPAAALRRGLRLRAIARRRPDRSRRARSTRRSASSGRCWPSPSRIRIHSPERGGSRS